MLRKIFLKKTNKKIKLGRWGTDASFLQSDFSNHDHCGSKVCQTFFVEKNSIPKKQKIDKRTLYLYPFLL